MTTRLSLFGLLSTIFFAFACQPGQQEAEMESGIDLANMDTTVNPANDFYTFVNGKWMEQTEMPADRSRWGSFNELARNTDEKTLKVLQQATESGKYGPETDQAKAALFYQTAMDTVYLDELGIEPALADLQEIDKIASIAELQQFLIKKAPDQMGYLFNFGVGTDPKNSNQHAAFLGSGAIGLPERDYYLNDDEDTREIQDKYKKHIVRMFGFFGVAEDEATEIAEQVYLLEKQMAAAKMNKVDRRNPLLRNNPRTVPELSELTPVVDWQKFFSGVGVSIDTVIVSELKYYEALNDILQEENLPVLKNYMKWTFINDVAGILSTELDEANFDFYGKVLSGQEKQRPRSERILSQANWTIGEAIGKLYVDEYFPPEAKATAEAMVDNIMVAFGERIKNLDWMSDSTKEKALHKLSTFVVKIGYPDEWKDYSELSITGKADGGSHYQNMKNISHWSWQKELKDLNEPVNKSEWFMAPQIVNAYYNPPYNEIVFPAAILQPPFYNYKADAAVNYGGIGAVIGHEVSHGFDDQGSRYDAEGNLKNWWTDEDRENFEARAAKLASQYSEFEVLPDVYVNGEFTLGENIGDVGGVSAAYDGLQLHLQQEGNPGLIDGFTPEQRFFISWATVWRTLIRDEALKQQVKTDPHSPGQIRAFAPLENVDGFYEAFYIKEGDKHFRPVEERVYIW